MARLARAKKHAKPMEMHPSLVRALSSPSSSSSSYVPYLPIFSSTRLVASAPVPAPARPPPSSFPSSDVYTEPSRFSAIHRDCTRLPLPRIEDRVLPPLPPLPDPPKEDKDDDEAALCIFCEDDPPEYGLCHAPSSGGSVAMTFHLLYCKGCADKIIAAGNSTKCPICDVPASLTKMFTPNGSALKRHRSADDDPRKKTT